MRRSIWASLSPGPRFFGSAGLRRQVHGNACHRQKQAFGSRCTVAGPRPSAGVRLGRLSAATGKLITLGSHKRLPSFLFLCEQPIRIYAWCIVSTAAMHCSSVTAASLHRQPGQQHLCICSQALQFSHSGAPGQQHLPDGSPPQCRHPLRHGTPCQQLCRSAPASSCATAPLPAKAPPRRPCQQQTSSGREKYSGLATNQVHLGRIC